MQGLVLRLCGVAAAGFETEDEDEPFHGHNKWPAESAVPGFRATMERYYGAMHSVAQRCVSFRLRV